MVNNFCVFVIEFISCYVLCIDMRKALLRDVSKESVVPLKKPISPRELEWSLAIYSDFFDVFSVTIPLMSGIQYIIFFYKLDCRL